MLMRNRQGGVKLPRKLPLSEGLYVMGTAQVEQGNPALPLIQQCSLVRVLDVELEIWYYDSDRARLKQGFLNGTHFRYWPVV